MNRIRFYQERDGIVIPKVFLEESEYSKSLNKHINVCTDCVFINKNEKVIYLVKRIVRPMMDWWFIGGKLNPGEYEEKGMHRHFKDDTGLDIPAKRFKFLTMKRYLFKDRQQKPQNTGCDSLCYVFYLELAKEEFQSITLNPTEYDTDSGLKRFTLRDLEEMEESSNIATAIADIYNQIFP